MLDYLENDLTPAERDEILERVAREVTRRRMEVPAVIALEMHRPLTFLGSQALIVFTPMLAPAFGLENLRRLTKLLEDRANLDLLLDRIEDMAAERDGKGRRVNDEEDGPAAGAPAETVSGAERNP